MGHISKKSEKSKLSNKKVGHTKKKLIHNELEHMQKTQNQAKINERAQNIRKLFLFK